ncbi:ABC transporter substrate-binding protein [Pusillimonas sp. CC-YST705]|uniref:ABC transporter substrate-binding protein n=1 Tax=Mesopusillimonas faecipullorum TaxID=2755040 RepID=A0ABS8CEL4_9BURK|nr:ABC transporter substrate-binding protein [Mesopusillimonas faecipullorum]MCB5364249.1 ABC transporter substrate-binding protein [Mesopusillimonas faecipullorum]
MHNRFLARFKVGVLTSAAALAMVTPAWADDIKVGLLSQYSGTYSWWGQEYDRGVELFLEETGGKVGDHTLSILRRDEGGTSPARSRQLAQELVVRDKAQYLVGGTFTPTVMGTADIVDQTKTPYVFVNGATSSMTDKTPYFVRVGYTSWAYCEPLVQWVYDQGARKAITVVADYAPGVDIENAFNDTFKKLGGDMVDSIRVPLGTTDFSAYLQRIKDTGVEHVFMFMPVGPMSAGFIKAFQERGLGKDGVALYAGAETQESDLPAIGDSALGIVTALHYSPYLDTAVNKDFVKRFQAKYGNDAVPSLAAMGAYDAMQLVAKMVEATDGKKDGEKALEAVKGYSWESPRGPSKIEADTREITQNIYIRRVDKVDGKLGNVPIHTYEAVKEPWHAAKQAAAK